MLAVIVMLLGMLCGQDAFAFYNSSTGRWLSRDPIEERGGQNIYCFLQNVPLSKVDASGLCDSGICGKDITLPLNKVLDEVNAKFDSWSRVDQDKSCTQLVYAERGAGVAWDIKEMGYSGNFVANKGEAFS